MSPRARDQHRSTRLGLGGGGPNRRDRISKAKSWLLRHGAHKEGIPNSEQGYVNVGEMLKWQKMSKELQVSFEEVLDEVRSNDKQRFALLYLPPEARPSTQQAGRSGDEVVDATGMGSLEPAPEDGPAQIQSEAAATATATSRALSSALSLPNPDPSHFLIRATQGHSIKTVSTSAYLSPITLDNPSSIPDTVVHGTFYAAWQSILRTGGLKPMSRVHVHFATGPTLRTVLGKGVEESRDDADAAGSAVLEEDKKAVVSGMRSDAQILIYINLRKALEMGIPFWKSENEVVLSEGSVTEGDAGRDQESKTKLVPMHCWDVVVEVKEGLGVLWRDGVVIKEVPDHLTKVGWPHRKGRKDGAGGRKSPRPESWEDRKKKAISTGGRGKPKLMVDREEFGFSK